MRIAIMQGRLLPPTDGRFQCFPREGWPDEFALAAAADDLAEAVELKHGGAGVEERSGHQSHSTGVIIAECKRRKLVPGGTAWRRVRANRRPSGRRRSG